MRPYGSVTFRDPNWIVTAEPHILLRMKKIFQRIDKGEHGSVSLRHSDEVCRDLVWLMDRYPLTVEESCLKELKRGSRRHVETIKRLEEIIDPNYKARTFDLALPPRDYQRLPAEIVLKRGYLLCADDVGLGKTVEALCLLSDRRALPGIVVTLSGTMPKQWEREANRFLPTALVHVVQKGTPYELPKFLGRSPDILVINYHKLAGWAETLAAYGRSIVFDEIQELRREDSQKRDAALHIARAMKYRLGLSATPIYNYGSEFWNVFDVLAEDALGGHEEFVREWCFNDRLKNPKAFGTYLREQIYLLRRTRADVKRELPGLMKIPQTVETNEAALNGVKESAAALARFIIAGAERERGEKLHAAEQLSLKLREATGVGKAPYVASFVRLLVENGEKVLLYGWHRAVYDILAAELIDICPGFYTGEETAAEKQEALRRFTSGETPILIMSLRAGAGVDGLQKVCRTVVFGELDWSPGVHEQCIGRIYRDGQPDPVTAYFLISESGSDPVVAETLGVKREQVEGIKDPTHDIIEDMQADEGRVARLAKFYLKKIGQEIPEPAKTEVSA